MKNSLQRVLLIAGTAVAVFATPVAARAQKALVYCPVPIDAAGCNAIVAALTGPAFPLGVDRGYDGTGGTVDLKTVDLFAYSVFVVPSLADVAGSAPYATLREVDVAEHLKAALIGRIALWSGTPDQGTTNRALKDALIQNLAGWASGAFATAKGPGLVALLDASASTATRYDWLRAITPLSVTADANLLIYDAARALNARGTSILTSPGGAIAYANMATYGFQVPNGAAGVSLDAVGQTGSSQGGQIILVTADAGNTSSAIVRTDRDDYAPGETVTITGSGWQAGEAVKLTLHMDPLRDSDTELMATADGGGNFTNTDFAPGEYDVGVRFVLTAVGQSSGFRAQTTFTDGKSTVTGTVTSATTSLPIANATVTCLIADGCNQNESTTTNASGVYTFDVNYGGNSATVTIRASAPGFVSGAAATNLSNGVTTTRNFVLTPAQQATALSVASTTVQFGAPISVSATLTSSGSPVSGKTINFTVDGSSYSGTTNASGVATASVTSPVNVSGSPYTIAGSFAGDAAFLSSSGTGTLTVTRATTSTVLTSNANPSKSGQSVTFTATVTYNAGTPVTTGSVTLVEGATCAGATLGGPTAVNASGVATFILSDLSVGSHNLRACYGANGNFAASDGGLTQVVQKAATTTTVTSSLNPAQFGQSVTFTATVVVNAPGIGTPTGTVTFKDGTTTIGTGTLDATGKATFSTSTLSVGGHTITAEYGGDAQRDISTSAEITQTITQAATTTTLASAPNPSVFGQSVTFTATVTSGAGTPNAGTVTFKEGTTTLGTGTVDATGKATFSTTTLSVASHSVTAEFGGAGNFAASTSAAVTQVVNQASSSTAVSSSTNPSVFGQSVTFTATVTAVAPGAGTPSGTVTFSDGATPLGTVALAGGIATVNTSSLAVGSHNIVAVYNADANFTGSTSTTLVQQVSQAPTTTAVVSSKTPTVFGESVTFTATVTVNAPGVGIPDGSVQFKDGATVLGTVTLAAGQASLSIATLSVGSHTITADYQGATNFAASNGSTTQVVDQATTTTSVTSGTNPSVFGQSVTFTATVAVVAPGAGTPTGSVKFYDGATLLGSGTLSGLTATFTTSALSVATHSITAAYDGDANFKTSTSSALSQVVNRAATSTAVASSANPSVFGQSVAFTATVTVTSPGAGTPSGTVTFKDGAITLGTGTLNGAGVATFVTSSLTVGSHNITAQYEGDASFFGSTSPVLYQTVNKAETQSVVLSSLNPSVFGQSVTFTATVTPVAPGAGTPTGSVIFKDGATTLSTETLSSGSATFTTSAFNAGTHSITVEYSGDDSFKPSTSAALSQIVNRANTTTSVITSKTPTEFGESVTFTATVAVVAPGLGVPNGSVTFKDGSTVLMTVSIDLAGKASFSTAALTVGPHTINVEYAQTANFNGSSGSVSQTVIRALTGTTVETSKTPTVFGEPVTFTATVALTGNGAGTPTGTVKFFDGVTEIGSRTLDASLKATFATSALAVATHSITAVYQGDLNFETSTSPALSQVVNRAATTTALVSSVNPSVFGQSVTFTATVSVTSPGAGTPTGTVTFKDGSTVLGTGTLNASRVATFTTASLSVATHSITAEYGGDGSFDGSVSAPVSQVVNKAYTSASVTSSLNPSAFGQSVTFTATVVAVAPGSGTPSGTVVFKDGVTTLDTKTLSGGSATLTTSALLVATHSITIEYGGDASFRPSTSPVLSQVVNKATTTSAVTVTPSTQQYSDKVTFEATLSPDQINGIAPATGVTFKVGTQTMGTATLSAVAGQLKATLSNVALLETVAGQMAPGARNVTAEFTGVNANFTVTNATTPLTITQEDARATYTGLAFVSTPSTSTSTATVNLRATIQDITAVLPASDGDAGDIRKATVKFVDRDASDAVLCTATLGLINPADSKTASASCDWVASIGSSDGAQFTVGIIVDGYYTRNASEDNAVLTVSKPYTGFITGGGFLINQLSSGTYSGAAGLRSNFGFNVKNNKSGSNLQGAVNIIIRSNGKVYQIKSNAISSMTATLANGQTPGTAQFSGKANLKDITNPLAPLSLGGNLTLNMTLTDKGEPGSSDTIGFTLWDGNTLLYSSNWSGAKTNEQVLTGGNTQVR